MLIFASQGESQGFETHLKGAPIREVHLVILAFQPNYKLSICSLFEFFS